MLSYFVDNAIFPESIIKSMEEEKRIAQDKKVPLTLDVTLVFDAESNDVITPLMVKRFADYIRNDYLPAPEGNQEKLIDTVHLSFAGYHRLTPQSIITLLGNENLVNSLDESVFRNLLISSESAAHFALSQPYIQARLNAYKPDENSPTFLNSCGAKAIVKLLCEHKILDEKEDTRSKELEIYKEIWTEPSGPAAPDKIVRLLEKYQLKVNGIEVKDYAEKKLQETKALSLVSYTQLFTAHGLFRSVFSERTFIIKDMDKIDEKDFKVGISTLLVSGGSRVSHILFAKNNGGTFEVLDPMTGKTTKHESFRKFVEANNLFLGVGFQAQNMSPRNKLS